MSIQLPPAFTKVIQQGLLNKYLIISAEAILVYDYFLMLPAEIEHIWMTKWGFGSLLYLLTRYIAFVESPFMILYAFDIGLGSSPNAKMLCESAYKIAGWLALWGIYVSSNILYLRTASIWGWTKRALACVVVANLIVLSVTIPSLSKSLGSMKCIVFLHLSFFLPYADEYLNVFYHSLDIPSPVPSMFPCNAEFTINTVYLDFVMVIITEICVIALTVYKRIHSWPKHSTPLLRLLYHDALLFFCCLIIVSILNLILYTTPSLKDYFQLLVQMQYILHSVSTARIILHLRITSSQPGANDGGALLSSEYMKKRVAFSSSRISDFAELDSNFEPIELHARRYSSEVCREEPKSYTVLKSYAKQQARVIQRQNNTLL
ncbi:hypothetical protein SCHPADRAFT_945899 [Schizopora paradoxa]|uniref:DUF6533 domain-containing protein n=1 Tax=Schizopora paradoxa TaxID=27342 RepID=A0A0H2RPE6_9AGAM|nr:hypothetical protein SCHPADRAFT_945899 [Schizopora paradoxa]